MAAGGARGEHRRRMNTTNAGHSGADVLAPDAAKLYRLEDL
jgi:hypothetical protein